MTFRAPVQNDLPAINEILTLSFSPIYAYFAKMSFSILRNAIVAEEGAEIIGAIDYLIIDLENKKMGYLYYLAVHPAFRRKGTGERLILRANDSIINDIGPAEIFAAAEKKNRPSREMLKKIGFLPISRSALKEKFGAGRFGLYTRMKLMPWEELFVLPSPQIPI